MQSVRGTSRARDKYRMGPGAGQWCMYILKFKNRTNRASHSTPKQKQNKTKPNKKKRAGRLERKGGTVRVKYGKVWGTGRQVKKSQQESSVDDRRNLGSKMHKS